MQIEWAHEAWEDYLYWQQTDKILLKRINALIKDIQRDPFKGIGKPEPLKHHLAGNWSRRINDEHRIIYYVDDDGLKIVLCRYHYPGFLSWTGASVRFSGFLARRDDDADCILIGEATKPGSRNAGHRKNVQSHL